MRSRRREPSARAIVPSGASTGRHEALELRDAENPRYGGLSVLRAVDNVMREIAPAVVGMDLDDQSGLDATADRARRYSEQEPARGQRPARRFPGRGPRGRGRTRRRTVRSFEQTLAGSTGCRPEPSVDCEPALPLPMVNMISGGLHAGGNLDIQDVLIIPVGASSYSEALEMIVAMYRAVGAVLKERGFESNLVGDEGGYGPRLRSNEQAFEIVVDAILACGFEPRRDVAIAVDVASTHFFDPVRGVYKLRANGDQALDSQGMIDLLAGWIERLSDHLDRGWSGRGRLGRVGRIDKAI